jgi:hypothetical protein
MKLVHYRYPIGISDFNLNDKLVRKKLQERYGNEIPLNETVISPAALFNSARLVTVKANWAFERDKTSFFVHQRNIILRFSCMFRITGPACNKCTAGIGS